MIHAILSTLFVLFSVVVTACGSDGKGSEKTAPSPAPTQDESKETQPVKSSRSSLILEPADLPPTTNRVQFQNIFDKKILAPTKIIHDFTATFNSPGTLKLKYFGGGYACMGFYVEQLQFVKIENGNERVIRENLPHVSYGAPVDVAHDKGTYAFRLRIETTAECHGGAVQFRVSPAVSP